MGVGVDGTLCGICHSDFALFIDLCIDRFIDYLYIIYLLPYLYMYSFISCGVRMSMSLLSGSSFVLRLTADEPGPFGPVH